MQALQSTLFEQTLSYAMSADVDVLTQIFEPQLNAVCWQRTVTPSMMAYIEQINQKGVEVARSLPLDEIESTVSRLLPEGEGKGEFIADLVLLAEMLSCLFDNPDIGLRLKTLSQAMCPKFHVDKVVCRLVCSYSIAGTQWLDNEGIDRAKLGHASSSDDALNCYVVNAEVGDVLLLKGDAWPNNEGAGVVHRSPAVAPDARRLVLTLDLM